MVVIINPIYTLYSVYVLGNIPFGFQLAGFEWTPQGTAVSPAGDVSELPNVVICGGAPLTGWVVVHASWILV